MNSDRGPGVVEAASYIELFRDRLVVVKLGGELLDGGPVLERILPQVAVLYQCGLRPLIVHGGGKQIDAACEARGIERIKHRGRRVTTTEVLEVMVEVVAGGLNRSIVDRLRREGVPASGFGDGTSDAVRCVLRPASLEDGELVDWGLVGDIVEIDAEPFTTEPGESWTVPVLPSIGTLEDGSVVNVNADAIASRLASELDSVKLVLMTGVSGVLESRASAGPISELTRTEAAGLIEEGIAVGGMRAKIEEALAALDRGVPRVHIISGREPATLLREIFTEEGCGTLLVPDPET
jgi:acetylglutamate kinase